MGYIQNFLIVTALSIFCWCGQANAYVMTVTNASDEAIKVDTCGWAVVGCSMMQGKIKHILGWKIWSTHTDGNTTYYKNAGADPDLVNNKPVIEPGHTAVLEFTDIDLGVCFDWSNFKIGLKSQGFSMQARSIGIVTGEAMQQLLQSASEITEGISQVGAAGEALGPKGKAAGAAIKGASIIASGAIKASGLNGCGNRSAIVTKVFDEVDGKPHFTGVVKVLVQQ